MHPNHLRAFIALDFPASVVQDLRGCWQILRAREPRVRWVKPENWHITLKFLGDIPEEDCTAIMHAMAQVCTGEAPLSVSFTRLGVFPNLHNPRILWLGMDDAAGTRMQHLRQNIQNALHTRNARRYPLEKRAFAAHLTLGRIKTPRDVTDLHALLTECSTLTTRPFFIDRMVLKKSTLTPHGAHYSDIGRVRLELPPRGMV